MEMLPLTQTQSQTQSSAAARQSTTIPYTLAPGLVPHKHKRRIAIHPAGQTLAQHWNDVKWVALARQLRHRGWQVAFLVKPAERMYWLSLTRGEFEIPLQHTLDETMSFIYESAFLIDNDSGHDHLATVIGCPVVTIDHSHQKPPPWILDNPLVYKVAPRFSMHFFQKSLWRPFLSVTDILKTAQRLVADNHL